MKSDITLTIKELEALQNMVDSKHLKTIKRAIKILKILNRISKYVSGKIK